MKNYEKVKTRSEIIFNQINPKLKNSNILNLNKTSSNLTKTEKVNFFFFKKNF
jgi:hypothetical protein